MIAGMIQSQIFVNYLTINCVDCGELDGEVTFKLPNLPYGSPIRGRQRDINGLDVEHSARHNGRHDSRGSKETEEEYAGREARVKTQVRYDDVLTEEQWLAAVEESDDSITEAAKRKAARGSVDNIPVHPGAFRNAIIQAARLEEQSESEQSEEDEALLDEGGPPNETSRVLSNGDASPKSDERKTNKAKRERDAGGGASSLDRTDGDSDDSITEAAKHRAARIDNWPANDDPRSPY